MGKKLLGNISLKVKLGFVVIIPIICVVILSAIKITILQNEVNSKTAIKELMIVSIAANNLVHELQKERGASAGYINSRGEKFSTTLQEQRKETDHKIEILNDILEAKDITIYSKEYQDQVKAALSDLNQIQTMRPRVDSFDAALSEAVGYYTDMNAEFLGITKKTLFIAEDPIMLRDISAYYNFIQSKERAGIERAVGAAGFSSGWNMALMDKFKVLILIQDTYIDVFLAYATKEETSFYNKKIKDPSFAEVDEMREIAFKMIGNSSANVNGVDAATWFSTITKKINILKANEDHLAEDVMHVATYEVEEVVLERNIFLIVLVSIIAVIIYLTIFVIKDVLGSIRGTSSVMSSLSEGDTKVRVYGTKRKDEIGSMSRAIEIFKLGLIEKNELQAQAVENRKRMEIEKGEAMKALAEKFDEQVGSILRSLTDSASQLKITAEGMRASADETSQ